MYRSGWFDIPLPSILLCYCEDMVNGLNAGLPINVQNTRRIDKHVVLGLHVNEAIVDTI